MGDHQGNYKWKTKKRNIVPKYQSDIKTTIKSYKLATKHVNPKYRFCQFSVGKTEIEDSAILRTLACIVYNLP